MAKDSNCNPNCKPVGYGNLIKYGYRKQYSRYNRHLGLSRSVKAYGYGKVQHQLTKKYLCYKDKPDKQELANLYARQRRWLRSEYLRRKNICPPKIKPINKS